MMRRFSRTEGDIFVLLNAPYNKPRKCVASVVNASRGEGRARQGGVWEVVGAQLKVHPQ